MENFLHPTKKIPSCLKIPSFVDTPKCPAWRNPLALGHGTAWDHYKMENFLHPTLKYPAAPKIPSSVDTTKYPAWSLFVDIPWLLRHRTAWDHYKMENYLHPTQKNTQLPQKYPALSIQQNTQLGVFLSTGLGFWTWDRYKIENYLHPTQKNTQLPQKYPALSIQQNTQLGVFLSTSLDFGTWQHGTTIKWKTFSSLPQNTQLSQNTNFCRYHKIPSLASFCRHPLVFGAWDSMGPLQNGKLSPSHPKKYPAAPKNPAPSIPVFLSTSLGFWDMGQHGTNGKLPENKFWSLCQHPLALGHGLKKNVVSLGRWWWEDVGRLRHYKMETPNPQKILPGRACNLYKIRAPNPSRNHSFLDVVKLKLYTGGWGFPFYSKKLAIFFILRLGSRVRWGLPFYSDGGFCSKFVAVNICFFKWISYFIEVHLFCDPGRFHFIEVPLWGGGCPRFSTIKWGHPTPPLNLEGDV